MVLGSGIRDPGSGKNLFRIPHPGVKKHPIPDPGSGSATLVRQIRIRNTARGVIFHIASNSKLQDKIFYFYYSVSFELKDFILMRVLRLRTDFSYGFEFRAKGLT
jgi:hypothetical protein